MQSILSWTKKAFHQRILSSLHCVWISSQRDPGQGLAMRDLHYQTRDSTFQIPGINPRNLEIGSKILVFTFLEDKTVSQNNTNSIFCIFKNSKERERQTDRQTERSPNLYWCSFGWFLSLSLLIFPFLHIYICLHSKDNIWE